MNTFELSRRFFDFAFENKECKSSHAGLFYWIVELNNRLGWKEEFGLPSNDTMEGLSVGNKNTYYSMLKDLERWGFIRIVKTAKNQFQSCIITICRVKSEPAPYTALDKALIQHHTRHCSSTIHGTAPIVKQLNKETIKQRNKETIPEILKDQEGFLEIWEEYKKHRKEKKSSMTQTAEKAALKMLEENHFVAISTIRRSIENGWTGLFPESAKSAEKISKPKDDFLDSLPSF